METNRTEEIIRALDLEALTSEEQEALLLELHELIYRGSMLRLVERMDEGTKERFAKLLEGSVSEEEIEAFIAQNVPDADAIVTETVQELTDDIVTVTGSK
jgi:hypothetical protein